VRSRPGLERLAEAGDFPKVVLIDTVSYCNLRCSMCVHRNMERKKGFMPWELFRKIVDEIAQADKSTRVWMVFFGEALIRKRVKPSIFDMIAYAKSLGLTSVVMNSNGSLLDEDAARKLVGSGLDAIYFGIDAFTPGTYARIRVGGDYHQTVKNVKNLIRLVREAEGAGPEIFVQFVEMKENRAEKEDFISFWSREGAKVKIRPKVSWAGLVEASNLVMGNEERWPCHWAMQTMSITDRGKVVNCAVDLEARFEAGDVNRHSLREVWGGALKRLRRFHREGRFDELPGHCRDCRDWQSARADYHLLNP
jgi:radical SAM protein with 4Fe4S-binding SPASM domain